MTPAYYNEIDAYPAQWLRNLIKAGHITSGAVDERSIRDVAATDVVGRRAHFFAGIGVWDYALRLAGWPEDVPVWTGSCPCQPFSGANIGRNGGFGSDKDLWPVWAGLVSDCRPRFVFGEQVGTGDGTKWLERTRGDLEGLGYSVASLLTVGPVLGYPERRRIFFVANSHSNSKRFQSVHETLASLRHIAALVSDEWDSRADVGAVDDGAPPRLATMRAYGNAINAQVAAAFIRAVMECL